MKILIKNGHIVDPSQGINAQGDLLVIDGKISECRFRTERNDSEELNLVPEAGTEIIDASGLYVFPGLVDMHVHLREPGFEYKETIKTGTMAAVKGGFTSVCCMPNTMPVNDNETVTEFILRKANAEGACNVFPIGAITKAEKGEELAEMGMMKEAGCIAFSDDGRSVMNSFLMRHALEYSKRFGAPIISHSEDMNLSAKGVMNEGEVALSLGLMGIPAEAEVVMIKRDIDLAALTKGRLHIAHVSTEGGVKAIREAKRSGINLTAETCPHYFLLTEEAVKGYNSNAKVNPPLRTERDLEALKEALSDGTIDVIVTDHAPHHKDEKVCEFDRAAPGISGLETALSLSLRLVDDKVLSLEGLIGKMTFMPARIMGIEKGTLMAGADADIVLVDMEREYTIDSGSFVSKGKNTPFDGWNVRGKVLVTICKGKIYDFRQEDR